MPVPIDRDISGDLRGRFLFFLEADMWDGYESRRWRRFVRPRILRRDRYRCREAARYGRIVEATTVHHIWPAEAWPEYAWCDWNLLSLSAEAHRAMHNEDGSLSALGESWRRRTIPPVD